MYRSNIDTVAAGPFKGPMVVSMRAIDRGPPSASRKKSASEFPMAHGSPVHWGDPNDIGIVDIDLPDLVASDASPIGEGPGSRLLGMRGHAPGGH